MSKHRPSLSLSTHTRVTLLAALALLALLPVAARVPGSSPDADSSTADAGQQVAAQAQEQIRFEIRLVSDTAVDGWLEATIGATGKTVYLSPQPALDTGDVARAWPESRNGEHMVGLYLTEEGALELARLTTGHIGERIAFLLDGTVVSTPRIMAAITGGRALIHGNLSEDEAQTIAERLTAAIAANDAE